MKVSSLILEQEFERNFGNILSGSASSRVHLISTPPAKQSLAVVQRCPSLLKEQITLRLSYQLLSNIKAKLKLFFLIS